MIIARLRYYVSKIRSAWRSGTLIERLNRKIGSSFGASCVVLWKYTRLSPSDRNLPVAAGFADARRGASGRARGDRVIFERICAAYSAACRAAASAEPPYRIRGIWAEWLKVNYGPLTEALTSGDYERTLSLLENFAREQFAVGTGGSYDELVRYRHSPFGRMYVKSVWCDYRDRLAATGFDLSRVIYPAVGNPAGIPLNGNTIQIDTLRHAHHASEICGLLGRAESPVVVEIGGGFGGQAHQIITQWHQAGRRAGQYLDFDIPEIQVVASYFLLKAFPEQKICLFGEGGPSDSFAIGLFPHFTIDTLVDRSADLMFNSYSFSEMDGNAALHYLAVVNRACRTYFMHINHETPFRFREPDGSVSENVVGSKIVPDRGHFRLVQKLPAVFKRPESGPYKSFSYLFERVWDHQRLDESV